MNLKSYNKYIYFYNIFLRKLCVELKQSLYQLFSQYGEILEIHCRKSYKMRGQAFIIFKDLNSATTAKHSLNNGLFFGKEMVIIIL